MKPEPGPDIPVEIKVMKSVKTKRQIEQLVKSKLTLSSLIRAIVVVVFCCSTTALAATDEIEVGVTAASVTNATGKPPISPARDLETGLEVFFNEKIKTNELGRAQLLFRDGTSLTVGSGSEMTIDEYVFDPDSGAGEMVVNISKGVFRLVGGKISKNTPVVFNTKTATVTLRGGIGGITVSNEGVEAYNHFGHMTMQNKLTGLASQTFKPGNALSLKPGALTAPTKQKIDPGKLAAMSSALERPVKKPSPAAEESTPQSTEPQAPALQAEEGQAETDQAEAASTEPTAQTGQAEDTGSPSVEPEPAADTEITTIEPQVVAKGLRNIETATRDRSATVQISNEVTTKLNDSEPLIQKAADSATATVQAEGEEKAAEEEKKRKAAEQEKKRKAAEQEKKKLAAAAAAAAAASSSSSSSSSAAVASTCLWYYSDDTCGEWSRQTAITLLTNGDSTELRADTYVYGKPIGTLVNSGSSSSPCIDCRFFNWQRQPLYASGNVIGLHYWVQGAATTAAELAAAAGKIATYSGGMIGSVAHDGTLREHQGRFDSRVEFGFSHYRINTFNAQFDNQRFSGASGLTPNSQTFGVTASALASGRDSARDRVLQASGYFAGSPAVVGSPPPEMGGSFNITGSSYSAQGVFLGGQH